MLAVKSKMLFGISGEKLVAIAVQGLIEALLLQMVGAGMQAA